MTIRHFWERWMYSVASPVEVEDRQHTADEVQEVVETVALVGTTRGLGIGIGAGLLLGISLPLFFWLTYQASLDPKRILEENELHRLQAENAKLKNLASVSKPAMDENDDKESEQFRPESAKMIENELMQLRSDNQRLRIQNDRLRLAVSGKPPQEENLLPSVLTATFVHPDTQARSRRTPSHHPPARIGAVGGSAVATRDQGLAPKFPKVAIDTRSDGRSSDR